MSDFLALLNKGRVTGPGSGVSDSIPAKIMSNKGNVPAALSEGEYVIRADAVSKLGGGATDPGVKVLDALVQMLLVMDRDTAAMYADIILETGKLALDTKPKIEDDTLA
jgi:hypothetical protein